MIPLFHKDFKKAAGKLKKSDKVKLALRLKTFASNHMDPALNNHSLSGPYKGCRSINISGDLRALHKEMDDGVIMFIEIGMHAKLYK